MKERLLHQFFVRWIESFKKKLLNTGFFDKYEEYGNGIMYDSSEGGYAWAWDPLDSTEGLITDEFGEIIEEKLTKEITNEIEENGCELWQLTCILTNILHIHSIKF